ncbi:MAG: hypothetical protein GY832_28320 [Chloroflexi bacterium]|nr:hypothetical protein [Chloroflexota bacterium]
MTRDTRYRFDYLDAPLSWGLGVIFLVAGLPHASNPYFFLGSIYAYDLVGPGVAQIVAMVLPWLQLILAVCLITRIWLDAAHLIALGMLGSFVIVQSLAFYRGLDISCGCFGPCHETPIGLTSILPVLTLFLLCLVRSSMRWRSLGLA